MEFKNFMKRGFVLWFLFVSMGFKCELFQKAIETLECYFYLAVAALRHNNCLILLFVKHSKLFETFQNCASNVTVEREIVNENQKKRGKHVRESNSEEIFVSHFYNFSVLQCSKIIGNNCQFHRGHRKLLTLFCMALQSYHIIHTPEHTHTCMQ